MTAKQYKSYPKYKDSGVEWLRQIPEQWEAKKLSYCLKYFVGFTPDTKESAFYGDGYNWATIRDLNGKYISETKNQITEKAVNYYSKPQVKKGSLLYSFKLSVGQVAYAVEDIYTNEAIASFPPSSEFCLNYLYYLSPLSILQNATENIYGAKILNQELINSSKLIVPPLPEQEKIAKFLDAKVGEIDGLVLKLEEQLKLIDEQRNSLITETVCKGLNPKAPMKDSGIEWLGKIPKHWEIKKLKYLINILTDYTANGSFADLAKNVTYLDGVGYSRLVRLTDLRDNLENSGIYVDEFAHSFLKKSELFGGEILLANVGAYTGYVCKVPNISFKATLGPNMFLLKFKDCTTNEYMYYLLSSKLANEQLVLYATSTAQPKLNKDNTRQVIVPFPPPAEQEKIVTYLNEKLSKIDALKSKTIKQIELLKEYKTSLITNVVTGKIDVRNEVI